MEDEYVLVHHGIKGMKWGIRKKNLDNPNYDSQQRKRDKQIYGSRGVRRINKSMNKGNRISVARGTEKTKKDSVRGKSKYVRQGGKVVGAGVGALGGLVASKYIRQAASSKKVQKIMGELLGDDVGAIVSAALTSPTVTFAAAAGAAKVGNMISGDIAVSTWERGHGYNPNRK